LSFQASLHRTPSTPAGWTEEHSDTGDVFFVNEITKERVSHCDHGLPVLSNRWLYDCIYLYDYIWQR